MSLERKLRLWIKNILQLRKLSYKDLALEIGVSESSIKRLLTRKKMNVADLENVCRFLGISPAEALIEASQEKSELTQLTILQEDLLCKNPTADYVFLRLMIGFSINSIINELSLDTIQTKKILALLKQAKLIKYARDGSPIVLKKGPFKWNSKGPFETHLSLGFYRVVTSHFEPLVIGNKDDSLINAFELYLCKSSYQNFLKDLKDLITKYKKLSRLDHLSLPIEELFPVSALIGIDTFNAWKKLLVSDSQLPQSHRL